MKKYLFLALAIVVSLHVIGQEDEIPFPPLSPKGNISQTIGNTLIEVEYERPSVRNREIYGGLVPWDKVWRTGAGNCTKISFDRDVKVGEQFVAAGKYSLFTIPNPEEWVIILNKDTTLYGSYDYDTKDDVVRFKTPPVESARFYETLNFDIELHKNNARMYISWANTQVSIEVKTSTNEDIDRQIESELITGLNTDKYNYAGASAYYLNDNKSFDKALMLADMAIEMDSTFEWPRYLKMKIYERLGRYDKAAEVMDRTLVMLEQKSEDRTKEIQQLKLERERIGNLKE